MTIQHLPATNLDAAFKTAQQAFIERGIGEYETWILPPGRHRLSIDTSLGALDQALTLRGNDTTLELDDTLHFVGDRVMLHDLNIISAAAGNALAIESRIFVRLSNIDISGGETALHISSPDVGLDHVNTHTALASGISLHGFSLALLNHCSVYDLHNSETARAVNGIIAHGGQLTANDISLSRLNGSSVTGMQLDVHTLALTQANIADLHASNGPGIGIVAHVQNHTEINTLRVTDISGNGITARPFSDISGDGAGALQLQALSGRVGDVFVNNLVAATGRAVALRIPESVESSGLSVARALAAGDLLASITQAQSELSEQTDGVTVEWQLPSGVFRLQEPLILGDSSVSLTLRGASAGTELRFEAADGSAIPGDLNALSVTADTLSISGIALRASASGATVVLNAFANNKTLLREIQIRGATGASVAGIVCTQSDEVEIFDCDIDAIAASTTDAIGLDIECSNLVIADITLTNIGALGEAQAMRASIVNRAQLSVVRVESINAALASGIFLSMTGPEAAASALDIRAIDIDATAGLANGISLLSAGSIEARALVANQITGDRALGVLLSATSGVDWLAGELTSITARNGGAAGARIASNSFAARDAASPDIAVRDVRVEALSASAVSNVQRPPDSWLLAAPTLTADLLVANSLSILPAPGMPGHVEEIVGIAVHAPVSDSAPIDNHDAGSVAIENCVFRRVSGTVLQLDVALRDVSLRACEAYSCVGSGWIDGERVMLANLSWHRMVEGFNVVTSDVEVWNSLVTQLNSGSALVSSPGGSIGGDASFVVNGTAPLSPVPNPLPYRRAGLVAPLPPAVLGGALIPESLVDLSIPAANDIHASAVAVPGDDAELPVYIGACLPESEVRCSHIDPAPPSHDLPTLSSEASPVTDYLNRDARGLLSVMLSRAAIAMPEWSTTNPADFTTMLMEMLAGELDHIAYRQEEAVANGYIGSATLQRALHDHARLVDHHPDAGLSATSMLRFAIDANASDRLGLTARFSAGETLTIPKDTLVVNPDFDDVSLIFATEEDLVYDPSFDTLSLHPDEPVAPGDLSALLAGDLGQELVGRWLTIQDTESNAVQALPHTVRIISIEETTDATRIFWDPRRPAPDYYMPTTTAMTANVVPACHGVPITPLKNNSPFVYTEQHDPLLAWRELLCLDIPAERTGRLHEVALPMQPVSRIAVGWPFPNESARTGDADITAEFNNTTLRLVDDLSDETDAAPVMALRPMKNAQQGLVLANTENSGTLKVALRIGLGAIGNVGAGALTRILVFGPGDTLNTILPGQADRLQILRESISVINEFPAVGGRDADHAETVRAHAPLSLRRAMSAVAPDDYERLLSAIDEVASVHAVAIDAGLRRVIRVTALLRDEDELARSDLGELRESERLRRWAKARRKLADIRLMGFDIELGPPEFVPLDIDLVADIESWAQTDNVRQKIEDALKGADGLFDPDVSGLGGDVLPDHIVRCALAVEGVKAVRLLRLRRLAPNAIDYAKAARMPVAANEVAVLNPPYGAQVGVLTVETCGGMA